MRIGGEHVGDYHIRMQFDIAADPGVVRRALTTQDGIASWWSSKTELDGSDRSQTLRVWFPDVPEAFEFAARETADTIDWVTGGFPPWWAGTTVRWGIGAGPDDGGTQLRFEHRDYDPENPVIPIVTPAWAQIILPLKGYAETGRPQPFFEL
jgi:hypothetical protein